MKVGMGAGVKAGMGVCFEADETRVLMMVLMIWELAWEPVWKLVLMMVLMI